MALTNKKFWVLAVIVLILGIYFGYLVGKGIQFRTNDTVVVKQDTTYDKVKLDSISKLIIVKDSTISKLNIKYKDDVEKSYMLSDSDAVALFLRLSAGK